MNDLIKQVKALDLTAGVAIVVTMPQGSLKHDADQIGWAIRKAIAPAENKILIIQDGMGIATLDEQQMRQYGWVKEADVQSILADHDRLVRELDVLLNGEDGAARQASLCDVVAQVRRDGLVAKAAMSGVLAALQKYEQAFDYLFGKCCSNGIFTAWGAIVDCTPINEAHELADEAIKNIEGKAIEPPQYLTDAIKQRDELVAAYEHLQYMRATKPMSDDEDKDLIAAHLLMIDAVKAAKGAA